MTCGNDHETGTDCDPAAAAAPLGILLYGYSHDAAVLIRTTLETLFAEPVTVLGAAGCGPATIETILDTADTLGPGPNLGRFEDGHPKMLMFLGFGDEQLREVLHHFPAPLERPIFCGLTEHNLHWSLDQLLADLVEEQRYWAAQRTRPGGDGVE